jgi:hypothetical protein
MAKRIEKLEATGPAVRAINNTLHGFKSLPLRVHAA